MRKKGPKPGRAWPLSRGSDPLSLRFQMTDYLEWMRVRNYSESSVWNRARSLAAFADWAEERALLRSTEITRPILERYQRHLFHLRKPDGRPLTVATQHYRLGALRVCFRWMARQHLVVYNPAAELELPRTEHRLPKAILSLAEVEQVMSQPELSTARGLRDRAILETLFSTGMRRKELAELTVASIDGERGTVMIRQGKGKKDRFIPIGERAVAWVEKYLAEGRPELVTGPETHVLFLSEVGLPLLPDNLSHVVATYVTAAELNGKSGSCHLFRHTMATMMLEGGADIRFIQQMLGHTDLQATQIYTQVGIRKLKEVHELTHPGARLQRKKSPDEGGGTPAVAEVAELEPADAEEPPTEEEQRAQLLSSLAAEAAEENERPEPPEG